MREIKFKAWDNVAQKMYSVGGETDVHFYLDSGGIKAEKFLETVHYTPEGGSDVCGDSETLEHLIYLQYTGLKDMNGVEIYEGDIVRIATYNNRYYVNKIVFEQGTFHFGHLQDGMCDYREMEVIGNVWEHTRLLEGEENAKSSE